MTKWLHRWLDEVVHEISDFGTNLFMLWCKSKINHGGASPVTLTYDHSAAQ
jgi:hypothetical protein